MIHDNESKEEFGERLQRIQFAYETILEEQVEGVDTEDIYAEDFDKDLTIEMEFNLCELAYAIDFIQNNVTMNDPVSSILVTGFMSSLVTSLPEDEFDRVVNGVEMANSGGRISFQ